MTRSACGGVRGRSSVRSARARAATDRPIAWNHYKAARAHLTIDAAHDTCGSGRSRPPWVAQPVLFEFRSPAALSVYPKRARRLTSSLTFVAALATTTAAALSTSAPCEPWCAACKHGLVYWQQVDRPARAGHAHAPELLQRARALESVCLHCSRSLTLCVRLSCAE